MTIKSLAELADALSDVDRDELQDDLTRDGVAPAAVMAALDLSERFRDAQDRKAIMDGRDHF